MNKNKILWMIFTLLMFASIINFIFETLKMEFIIIKLGVYFCSILLLFLHILWNFGMKKGLFFVLTSFFIGLLFEIIGVKYGNLFGGFYTYKKGVLGPMFFGVPILIPMFWSFFIYTGYNITSSFLEWFGLEKPNVRNKKVITFLFLIMLDILIIVNIDLIMDPIMVQKGYWFWKDGGSYFNIPIGNFIGWAIVVFFSSLLIRTHDYFCKESKLELKKDAFLLPTIGYLGLFILFFMESIRLGIINLGLMSVFILLPIPLLNILMYINKN